MQWNTLIQNVRLGCEKSKQTDNRNSYYRDFDRIVFSKEFRLLQAKTQVVPFPEQDATHTRLTHSIETASVGRSLGIKIAEKLSIEGIAPEDLGAIVAAACLCHDIGNPPLGHSGEDAISQYFRDDKGSKMLDKYVTKDQRFDFEHFEGNAMGFHLLTHHNIQKTTVPGGLGLTYATLAAFMKYPNRMTEKKEGEKKQDIPAYRKKPGLLSCDVPTFRTIANKLEIPEIPGLPNTWCRHPLAYLTEAADDICYAIVDLEDGYRNGSVSYEETEKLLNAIIKADGKAKLSDKKIIDYAEKIGYLRAKAINSLISLCVEAFAENVQQIMEGTFSKTLISSMQAPAQKAYDAIITTERKKVYAHEHILMTEAAGFVVLPGLLDICVSAAFEDGKRSEKIRNALLKDKICEDPKLTYEERNYETLLNIVKYVAFMTDTFAVKTYRELTGIQLPNY